MRAEPNITMVSPTPSLRIRASGSRYSVRIRTGPRGHAFHEQGVAIRGWLRGLVTAHFSSVMDGERRFILPMPPRKPKPTRQQPSASNSSRLKWQRLVLASAAGSQDDGSADEHELARWLSALARGRSTRWLVLAALACPARRNLRPDQSAPGPGQPVQQIAARLDPRKSGSGEHAGRGSQRQRRT